MNITSDRTEMLVPEQTYSLAHRAYRPHQECANRS